jgi:hypothetical protein
MTGISSTVTPNRGSHPLARSKPFALPGAAAVLVTTWGAAKTEAGQSATYLVVREAPVQDVTAMAREQLREVMQTLIS